MKHSAAYGETAESLEAAGAWIDAAIQSLEDAAGIFANIEDFSARDEADDVVETLVAAQDVVNGLLWHTDPEGRKPGLLR